MSISLLVAYTKNKRVIGAQGKIPWNIPSERNRFKQICKNKPVIMGRKSFEEIGKPLSYCTLVVISKNHTRNDVIFADSIEDAVEICKKMGEKEILVAGGGSIYKQTLPFATKIYATEIDADFDGDVFFPELTGQWTKSIESVHEENGIKYSYVTFIR